MAKISAIQKEGPLDNLPMTITDYLCPKCQKMHKAISIIGYQHRKLVVLRPNEKWAERGQNVKRI